MVHCGVVRSGEVLNDESLELLNCFAENCRQSGASRSAFRGTFRDDGWPGSERSRNALDQKRI